MGKLIGKGRFQSGGGTTDELLVGFLCNQVTSSESIVEHSFFHALNHNSYTPKLHYTHAAGNLNSGYSKYMKVVCMHYFCTVALGTHYMRVSVV